MDLVKEFDIDVDLLIAKTDETKQRIKELENSEEETAKQELEKLQFEFDTYSKYLWIHFKNLKPKNERLENILEYQQKILELFILTSKNDNTDLQNRINLAKMEYERDTDKEKAGLKLLETFANILVENTESELKNLMD